ncbi:LacI family transcriptional regulator [Actinomycetaceae bacterium WB03_NA08]|uniref:LacI family transcriptional regulator n=1 Tax=Scrofimicrobium canadense TaxID=2652290 RepID=A0A6N7W3V2_9ACTO|nr:LacI family DNA-binding transcriptional regulator [Scrofimicrobium canadense]MSS83183.1 LacI family transcriptional regulator [Scrofimicrobium canadense]
MTDSSKPSGRRNSNNVTINDVARHAGVSKTAVSFVFNGRPGISEEAQKRTLDSAEKLGWRPDAKARALSLRKSRAIGLVIRREPALLSTDPFFPQFVAGAEIGMSASGYALVLQVADDIETENEAYRTFARESRVDGVFLTDLTTDDQRPAILEELGVPATLVCPPKCYL